MICFQVSINPHQHLWEKIELCSIMKYQKRVETYVCGTYWLKIWAVCLTEQISLQLLSAFKNLIQLVHKWPIVTCFTVAQGNVPCLLTKRIKLSFIVDKHVLKLLYGEQQNKQPTRQLRNLFSFCMNGKKSDLRLFKNPTAFQMNCKIEKARAITYLTRNALF